MLAALLALPARNQLPMLSEHPIAGVETLWFNRDRGRLARAIGSIIRRKYDAPYFSWSVTPPSIRERYFRTFAGKFNWNVGATDLVREGFLRIAKKRVKGIACQVKRMGKRPLWISHEVWQQMEAHWNTPDAKERSKNASDSRNSDRDGFGPHKHVSCQKSYAQIQQKMEVELGGPVSIGEVFVRAHTRGYGTFIDMKAKRVVDEYEKELQGLLTSMEVDGTLAEEISSQGSVHQVMSILEHNVLFFKCTETSERGTAFGLGRLQNSVRKGKGNECYVSSSGTGSPFGEMQQELKKANDKILEQAQENEKRYKAAEAKISSLEMMVSYLRSDPGFVSFMEVQEAVNTDLP